MEVLFSIESSMVRAEIKDEATVSLIDHLECHAFDFFYEAFAENRQLAEERSDYEKAKQASVDKSGLDGSSRR